MKTINYLKKWEKLENEVINTNKSKIIFTENDGNNSYFAINENNKKILYIEFNKDFFLSYKLANINGITFDLVKNYNINPQKLYLEISNHDKFLENAFIAFTVNLLSNIESSKSDNETLELVNDTITEFKAFFSTKKKWSKEQEQGLVAELLFLDNMINLDENLIYNWYGPSKNKHDFIFNNNSIEIKSSSNQKQKIISVSNENQLTYKEGSKLYLKLYIMEERSEGESVSSLIDTIIKKLCSKNKNIFIQKLIQLGIDINTFESCYFFDVCDTFYYIINENFPTINYDGRDNRIFDIKYKLNLFNVECMEIEMESLIK